MGTGGGEREGERCLLRNRYDGLEFLMVLIEGMGLGDYLRNKQNKESERVEKWGSGSERGKKDGEDGNVLRMLLRSIKKIDE